MGHRLTLVLPKLTTRVEADKGVKAEEDVDRGWKWKEGGEKEEGEEVERCKSQGSGERKERDRKVEERRSRRNGNETRGNKLKGNLLRRRGKGKQDERGE
jgi:hypothetical protein